MSLAALEGWTRPWLVTGLFVGLELFTNLVVEPYFYAGAAGVSQVGLLVAVAFWTWLWGPLGLLLATPLTVCIVVIGKYVPGFEFLATLLSDAPAPTSDLSRRRPPKTRYVMQRPSTARNRAGRRPSLAWTDVCVRS